MKYSIIIAVYNRLEEVKELLFSAEEMNFNNEMYELLFVDDGSNDGFKDFIEEYIQTSKLNIKVVYQENKGPGAARNNGMSVSKAEYFIFMDSDCLFTQNYLQEVDEVVESQNLDAFGGPDGAHPDFSPMVKAINYSMTSFLGTGGTRGNKKSVGKFYPRSFNMGIKREVFEKIGGMNALRHGQDMDFSARIYNAGFKVGFISDAIVFHKRRTSIPKFYRQIFNWGVARINLGSLHKQMLKPIHFFPTVVVLGYFAVIVLAFFSSFFAKVLSLVVLAHILVCVVAFVQSFSMYKEIKVAFLSIITLNIQVFAYGLGLLTALWQKLLGKKEAKGFVKNYYGKKKS